DPAHLYAELLLGAPAATRKARKECVPWDAEFELVGAGRKGDLGIAHALVGHLGAELVDDLLVVFGGLEAAGDGDVDLDEVRAVAGGRGIAIRPAPRRAAGRGRAGRPAWWPAPPAARLPGSRPPNAAPRPAPGPAARPR